MRCLFFPCRWLHLFNVVRADDAPCGVWQCSRCKTVSIGKSE